MTEPHSDDSIKSRYRAEIERVQKHLDRFTAGKMRLFEEKEGRSGMIDITALYIDELEAHVEELRFFASRLTSELRAPR